MPPTIIPSEEISHRTDFSLLCNARGYKDAVEIGVDLGRFAADFLSRFEGNWLIGVDPYTAHEEFRYDRSGDLLVAVQAMARFHGRWRLVRARSVDAAPWVATVISPEFCYIDGGHDEKEVAADIAAWWPILPVHGLLSGHDYDDAHPGVVAAVNRFAEANGLVVRVTHETTSPASWMIYKTEPKTLFRRLWADGEMANPYYVEPDQKGDS